MKRMFYLQAAVSIVIATSFWMNTLEARAISKKEIEGVKREANSLIDLITKTMEKIEGGKDNTDLDTFTGACDQECERMKTLHKNLENTHKRKAARWI